MAQNYPVNGLEYRAMKKQIKMEFEGKTFTIEAERNGENITITRDGKDYSVRIIPEEAVVVKKAAPKKSAAPVVVSAVPTAVAGGITAPMAGLVKEILAAAGSTVEPGQVVVIMEAMKMDIEVKAAAAGTVKEVYAAVNTNVTQGQPLLSIG
jgi:oxaloacetate decarboxylase alpha subunit